MRALIRVFPIAVVVLAAALYASTRPDGSVTDDAGMVALGGRGCGSGELSMAALDAVLQMDSERALPVIRKVLKRRDGCSEELRRKGVFLAAQQPVRDAAELLEQVIMDDPSLAVRKQAVFWLSEIPGDRARVTLEKVLEQDAERELKEQAIFVLSQRQERWAVDRLMEVARSESDPQLRKKALFWLGQSRDPRAAELLMELIER